MYTGDRLFKYLFLGIFFICQHFFKLLLIIFVMNFASVNIFYLNNVSFGVDNVKIINGRYSLTTMAEEFWNYGQEVFISVSVTPENTNSLDYLGLSSELSYFDINFLLRKHILQKQSSQFLKVIYFGFCNFSMFLQSSKQLSWFWCKILF